MESQGSSLLARIPWPAAWRGFASFLRAPSVPDRAAGINGGTIVGTLQLWVLDLLLMLPILITMLVAESAGAELPSNMLEQAMHDPYMIVMIVIGAPLIEETMFRGWLSGRPGHVGAIVALLLGGIVLGAMTMAMPGNPFVTLGVGAVTLGVAIAAIFVGRKYGPPKWYKRFFGWFYLASALAFASIHIFNYEEGSLWLLAVLVVPQLVSGLVLGYARVTNGLWSSMAMHAMFNGTLVALVLAVPQPA